MFKKIVVGVDGSERAKTALQIACDIGRHYDSEITLIHVPHAETAAFMMGGLGGYYSDITRPAFSEIEIAGEQVLHEAMRIAREAGCKRLKTHMPHGDAAAEILAHANEIGADLIVTGRRGLGGIASLVMGSTTHRINHLAACACLSIP